MSDTPDLSKVVNLIMENPALISQITDLVKNNDTKSEETDLTQTEIEAQIPPQEASQKSEPTKRESRQKLLYAMKPYLKSERAHAIDSMLSVVEILDMVRSK